MADTDSINGKWYVERRSVTDADILCPSGQQHVDAVVYIQIGIVSEHHVVSVARI